MSLSFFVFKKRTSIRLWYIHPLSGISSFHIPLSRKNMLWGFLVLSSLVIRTMNHPCSFCVMLSPSCLLGKKITGVLHQSTFKDMPSCLPTVNVNGRFILLHPITKFDDATHRYKINCGNGQVARFLIITRRLSDGTVKLFLAVILMKIATTLFRR